MLKNKTQNPWPGLEPGQVDPESSAISRRLYKYMYFGPGSRSSESYYCLKNKQNTTWNGTITLVQLGRIAFVNHDDY